MKRTFASLPGRWLMLEYKQPSPWVSEASLAEAEKPTRPDGSGGLVGGLDARRCRRTGPRRGGRLLQAVAQSD